MDFWGWLAWISKVWRDSKIPTFYLGRRAFLHLGGPSIQTKQVSLTSTSQKTAQNHQINKAWFNKLLKYMPHFKCISTVPPNRWTGTCWRIWSLDLVVRSFHDVKGWGLNKMRSNGRYQQPCSADESCAHLQLVLTFFGHLCEQLCLLSR